ncbi:MAG: MarR family transcriptional regulator [candidate division Zixibacteria bacterium]|nr:MarR family transcriptional regulator [candidate division Zixibacteria bacterium]
MMRNHNKNLHPNEKKCGNTPLDDTQSTCCQSADVAGSELSVNYCGDDYYLRIIDAIRRITRAADVYSRRLKNEYEVTSPQLATLIAIQRLEPASVGAVAREIHISPSTLVGVLDRLEAKGQIVRHRSIKDRRLVQISLTELGRQFICKAPPPLQQALNAALERLSEVEKSTIAESLEYIVKMMEVENRDKYKSLRTITD